jgi:hypothetical protein
MSLSRAEKLENLHERRVLLIARAQRQREDIGLLFNQLESKARPLDLAWRIYQKVRQHPLLITFATALVTKLILRRSGLWNRLDSLPGRLTALWQLWKRGYAVYTQMRQARQSWRS